MNTSADRTESIFAAVAALPAEERAAYLDRACPGDPELRAQVEALLRAHDRQGHLLDQPAAGPPVRPAPSEEPGVVLAGRYKLIEQIGEGGMGTVWAAEQTEPVRRQVAVKLIKPGMDSKAVLSRFEAERQALAVMDHPNIAKVLDGGQVGERGESSARSDRGVDTPRSPGGRPFFVMEYVRGVPITTYCDDARLSIAERLALFVPVCQAVQHAHQKGVIHRDLKPSNILVCPYDGRPVPKVIDFGLAKATQGQLTEATLHSAQGVMIGTPLYMSPEQAELNNLDVDTRTDIYALGVILYELLTGTTPLERQRFERAAWHEVLRLIREEEPPQPSTRLSGSGSLPTVAAQRQLEPVKLTKLVRGELDWIVMKALEKDRTRRYATANGLAADIERHLADEPVQAGPPSRVYRLRKFVRRNRGPVLAAFLVAVALAAGIVGTTVGLLRAQAAQKAEEDRAEGERQAKETAVKRLAQIEKGIGILTSVFENLDPREEEKEGRPLRAILGDRLQKAAEQLHGEAVGGPVAVARLQVPLGRSLLNLGLGKPAIELFLKSHRTLTSELGHDHPDTLDAANNLAVGYRDDGQLAKAQQLHEETLALRKVRLGIDDPATLESMNNLAAAYREGDKVELAVPLHEEALRLRKAKLGPRHVDTLVSMNNLAMSYHVARKLDLAVPLYEETLRLRKEVLGDNHRSTLTSMNNLALGYRAIRRPDLALPLHEETFRRRVATQGREHPDTLTSMNNLAGSYQIAGKMGLALPLFEDALKISKAKRPADHPDTLVAMNNLASAYYDAGKLELALPLAEDTVRLRRAVLGDDNPRTLTSVANLGNCYFDAGKLDQALAHFQDAAERIEKRQFRHEFAQSIVNNLADTYEELKQPDRAELWRRKWLAVSQAKDGPESAEYASQQSRLGANLLKQKRHAEAETLLRQSLGVLTAKQPLSWETFRTRSLLGAALVTRKQFAEAEPLLLEGRQGLNEHLPKARKDSKRHMNEAVERLVQLYDAWGKQEQAAHWRKELEAIGPPDKPKVP